MFVTIANLEPQGVSTSTFEPIALKPLSIVAKAMFFFNRGEYAALVTFPHVLFLFLNFPYASTTTNESFTLDN